MSDLFFAEGFARAYLAGGLRPVEAQQLTHQRRRRRLARLDVDGVPLKAGRPHACETLARRVAAYGWGYGG